MLTFLTIVTKVKLLDRDRDCRNADFFFFAWTFFKLVKYSLLLSLLTCCSGIFHWQELDMLPVNFWKKEKKLLSKITNVELLCLHNIHKYWALSSYWNSKYCCKMGFWMESIFGDLLFKFLWNFSWKKCLWNKKSLFSSTLLQNDIIA